MPDKSESKPAMKVVIPSIKDPRVTLACALTLWTVLGQQVYYFNRDPFQIGLALGIACGLDFILSAILRRQWVVPISAYLTALSIGLLLESQDWRVYVVAPIWGVLSKYLLRIDGQHFFNPSNFGIVVTLLLAGDVATIAPGSQWGADYRLAVAILCIGLVMMFRIKRLGLALAWLGGYVAMSLLRVALRQGSLVFALGPMTGAEFVLFTFSMLPDPKASPTTRRGRIAWGISIAVLDGILRYNEVRFSMFYALFVHTALLPVMRWIAARQGATEADPWKFVQFSRKPRNVQSAQTPTSEATT